MPDTPIEMLGDDARWSAVERRDQSVAGLFLYAVKTTGVYCRPGCASRLPRRENVLFFENPRQARAAGYRACKRCRPDAAGGDFQRADAVRIACELIDTAEETPSLEQLSAAVDYSPAHFHRIFKRTLGVTPKSYAAMRRADRVRNNLLCESSVTRAAYSSGYATQSRFYEKSSEVLGMKPSEYRAGAKGITIRVAVVSTTIGVMLVAATERGLCAIEFGDSEEELLGGFRERFPGAKVDQVEWFQRWVAAATALVESDRGDLSLPLDIQGTAFQCRVWDALRKIPPGSTTTYAELADAIQQPTAVRAVAGACAANRLAVVIPCHRVIRSDGKLGGYRWGIERKQALLERERQR